MSNTIYTVYLAGNTSAGKTTFIRNFSPTAADGDTTHLTFLTNKGPVDINVVDVQGTHECMTCDGVLYFYTFTDEGKKLGTNMGEYAFSKFVQSTVIPVSTLSLYDKTFNIIEPFAEFLHKKLGEDTIVTGYSCN